MKYLLIDSNNLAIRSAFANESLTNKDGIPTGAHYGVFQSLINLKQSYRDYQFLMAWDGKSKRRMTESEEGVKKGLIKAAYKANRKKDEQPKPLLDFYAQSLYLKRGIDQTGIPQIRLGEYEADDIISSYCKQLDSSEIVVVTSDFDYLQVLTDKVSIWDGMKQKLITKKTFVDEYKIEPCQYVDVGALMGDAGDNIFGLNGWGNKTALEAIQEHGSWEKLYSHYHATYDSLRVKFPDLNDPNEFQKLSSIVTQSGKAKYAEITLGMPFTGVTLATEEKKTPAISKSILVALMFEERVKLAYSLKKMDDGIKDLPCIVQGTPNEERLLEYFDYYDMTSLRDSVSVFK
jgi:5'-3' exonuclease